MLKTHQHKNLEHPVLSKITYNVGLSKEALVMLIQNIYLEKAIGIMYIKESTKNYMLKYLALL